MIRTTLFIMCLIASVMSAQTATAQETHGHEKGHIMLNTGEFEWRDGPASLPAGAQFAVLQGTPSESGPFTMRLRLPANYRIMPHHHPAIEHVTVVEGTFHMGLGETFDDTAAHVIETGGFAVMEIGTVHFAFTKDEPATIQLHGIGPWDIIYVNPEHDPRNVAN